MDSVFVGLGPPRVRSIVDLVAREGDIGAMRALTICCSRLMTLEMFG